MTDQNGSSGAKTRSQMVLEKHNSSSAFFAQASVFGVQPEIICQKQFDKLLLQILPKKSLAHNSPLPRWSAPKATTDTSTIILHISGYDFFRSTDITSRSNQV
ncbi:hypothetical protein V6N12_052047 [Hibiscus sabdariffa]|uniref:Uncharacterized protein n=1 Tax=Hibiscus sabdariffa TaxID=183260 RepID=A0ABR2GH47_9ROSI